MNKFFKMLEMGDDWIKTFKILFARNKKFRISVASSMLVLAVGVTQQVHAFLIDSFDVGKNSGGSQLLSFTGAGGGQSLPRTRIDATSTAIGGWRRLGITANSDALGDGGTTISADAGASPGTNKFAYSNVDGVSSSGYVLWDNNGAGFDSNGATAGGGIDITDGGLSTWLKLTVTSYDQGDINLSFNITDTAGNIATLSLNKAALNLPVPLQTPVDVQFVFSSFSNPNGALFTDVNKIQMLISTGLATDISLDAISTSGNPLSAPEPTTLALISLGIAGFAAFRKRKQM